MRKIQWKFSWPLLLVLLFSCGTEDRVKLRIAQFNIRELSTGIISDTSKAGIGLNPQARAAAQIIQNTNPDILVIQEMDHDYSTHDLLRNARAFHGAYLNSGNRAIKYDHIFTAPCNTGILAGIDLNGDGRTAIDSDDGTSAYGGDSFGWGVYPGQYSMSVYSRFPIEKEKVRTFRNFLWKDLPGHHIPADFYTAEAISILRLSSKSHWDLPLRTGKKIVHLLVSHPTPPVFDGPEDRNGRRNFDEIGFWAAYIGNGQDLYDDKGKKGGLERGEAFVIIGDLNADPGADVSYDGTTAIAQLLDHPQVINTGPMITAAGGREGRAAGAPDFWERKTSSFSSDLQLQIDYILPSNNLSVLSGGMFWPSSQEDAEGNLLAMTASDHRLLWLDIKMP